MNKVLSFLFTLTVASAAGANENSLTFDRIAGNCVDGVLTEMIINVGNYNMSLTPASAPKGAKSWYTSQIGFSTKNMSIDAKTFTVKMGDVAIGRLAKDPTDARYACDQYGDGKSYTGLTLGEVGAHVILSDELIIAGEYKGLECAVGFDTGNASQVQKYKMTFSDGNKTINFKALQAPSSYSQSKIPWNCFAAPPPTAPNLY